ncbi:hypothetical protein LC040_10305 [Bacillus tianshenii]|nr:hypothetical protein LC040_10305 [Bacillus tianshenii]
MIASMLLSSLLAGVSFLF